MGALRGLTRALFYSFSNSAFNWELVGIFGFLERGNLFTVLLLLPSPSPTPASLALYTYADKFWADLVMELNPLLTSASSAMSDGEFSANQVGVVLSIEVSGLANLLKPWMKRQ